MSPFLTLPCRTLEEAMMETVCDRIDAAESIAEQIEALYAKAKRWAGDDLEDTLQYLEEAAAAARHAAKQLQDELPHYERLPEPSRAL